MERTDSTSPTGPTQPQFLGLRNPILGDYLRQLHNILNHQNHIPLSQETCERIFEVMREAYLRLIPINQAHPTQVQDLLQIIEATLQHQRSSTEQILKIILRMEEWRANIVRHGN